MKYNNLQKEISEILLRRQEVRKIVLSNSQMLSSVASATELIISAIEKGGKILVCGNGGSASDAMHFVAELVGRFKYERPALPALALVDNASVITAIGNDYGYEDIFSRQVRGLIKKDDVLVGISTSGNSLNVCEAVKTAKRFGAKTVALTGRIPTEISRCDPDCIIKVPLIDAAEIQEIHIMVIHIICEMIEKSLFVKI